MTMQHYFGDDDAQLTPTREPAPPSADDEYIESIRKLVETYEQGADYSLEREDASTQLEALAPSMARRLLDIVDRLKGEL